MGKDFRLVCFRMTTTFTLHAAFFICAILLYIGDVNNYGQIITNES